MIYDTYAAARAAFLEAARDRAAIHEENILPGVAGREGETLSMDVVTLGERNAPKALLVVSGAHGLECMPGSGAQLEILLRTPNPPADTKIVLVHALNPWGASHGSRTDENNVDINRNFVDFAKPYVRNAAYDELYPFLCPDDWTDDVLDRLAVQQKKIQDERGGAYLLDGMTAGQRQEPRGTNFGGVSPSWTRTTLERAVKEHLGGCEKVAFVDWHTGFGGFADVFHICNHPPGSEALELAAAWWGRETVTRNAAAFPTAGGATPNWQGLFSIALPDLIPEVAVAGSVVEFGTYPNAEVRAGVLIDRFLKFGRSNRSSTPNEVLRQRMLSAFAPPEAAWRTAIIERSVDVHGKALAGLAAW